MDAGALRMAAATVFLGVVIAMSAVEAQADPFVAMNALRVVPPGPAPDVAFRALDGSPVRLAALRDRPVLLTFFTTW